MQLRSKVSKKVASSARSPYAGSKVNKIVGNED